jgi:hypothetical protein
MQKILAEWEEKDPLELLHSEIGNIDEKKKNKSRR